MKVRANERNVNLFTISKRRCERSSDLSLYSRSSTTELLIMNLQFPMSHPRPAHSAAQGQATTLRRSTPSGSGAP